MSKTKKIVGLGILTAIVVVLQLFGSSIKFGMFSISLVLVPIVVGAAIYGFVAGGWLGFVFGVAVLASGDAAAFLTVNAIGTVITVLLKGTLAGFLTGLVYKLFSRLGDIVAVALSAVVCPIVNTGIFLVGCLLFFIDTVTEWAGGSDVGKYMIFTLVGVNFIVELVTNVLLAPTIVRIVRIGKK